MLRFSTCVLMWAVLLGMGFGGLAACSMSPVNPSTAVVRDVIRQHGGVCDSPAEQIRAELLLADVSPYFVVDAKPSLRLRVLATDRPIALVRAVRVKSFSWWSCFRLAEVRQCFQVHGVMRFVFPHRYVRFNRGRRSRPGDVFDVRVETPHPLELFPPRKKSPRGAGLLRKRSSGDSS